MKVCTGCGVAYPKSSYPPHTGKCKPCKKEYNKHYRELHKSNTAKKQTERRNTKEGYIDRFIERARKRTVDSDLDRDFFKDKMDVCVLTGYPFTYKNVYDAYHNPTAPSIDRIDSKMGYYTWNTQVVLSCINRMKNDLPQKNFEELWKSLVLREFD